MAAVAAWLRGWRKSLSIRLFEPDLYRELTTPISGDEEQPFPGRK